jgi:serpin B
VLPRAILFTRAKPYSLTMRAAYRLHSSYVAANANPIRPRLHRMFDRLTALTLLATLTSASAAPSAAKPQAKPAPFAAQLDGQLAKRKGNFIYSPASISVALAMTREGALGDTAAAMDRVLGSDAGKLAKDLTKAFKSPKQEPGRPTVPDLAIANRLFGDARTVFLKPFQDITSKEYLAPIESLDFRTAAEAARKHINDWVAKQTHDHIKDLLPPPSVSADTRMVLVNAIYMKASWATAFEPSLTKPAPFALDGGASKKVDTMHMEGGAAWGDHAGARTVDLPYYSGGGPKLAMLVVVPDGKSLAQVEAAYAGEGLAPFLTATSSHGLAAVALPRFEVGTDFELSEPLDALGMGIAFSDAADFGGMSKVGTHISAVVHKAWAKVDEKGTEAAAATAVVMGETAVAVKPMPHKFDVDHGNVLFGGRIVDPSAR